MTMVSMLRMRMMMMRLMGTRLTEAAASDCITCPSNGVHLSSVQFKTTHAICQVCTLFNAKYPHL